MGLPQALRLELLRSEVRTHDRLEFLQRVGDHLVPPPRFGRRSEMDVADDARIACGQRQEFGHAPFVKAAHDNRRDLDAPREVLVECFQRFQLPVPAMFVVGVASFHLQTIDPAHDIASIIVRPRHLAP